MENIKKSKAVIYCRVSTKEQAEEGNSLVTQERNCREYALKYSYEVAQVFVEEGESAKTADRTELQKLLRFCADKKENIKAVIIYKIDRLSRNTDDYSQLRLLLKRYGVEIKSTSEYFENTPAGRFMENIIANVAQFDNDVRTERSVGGLKDAVRDGRYVWMAPVGYKNDKIDGKANITQSDMAGLVYKAFEMMAERRYSVDAIRETLYSMGLTTKSGKSLSRSKFYAMLKNDLYAGWICKFGEKHKGKFEPIIPQELFDRVQMAMRNKKVPSMYRKENPDFPLRRFITHSEKMKLTGSWSKGRHNKYAYYRFHKTKLYWPKEHLESQFCSFMDEFAFNESLLQKLREEMFARFSGNSKSQEKNLESLALKKQQLKDKQNALLQKNIDGIISDSMLKEHIALLDDEIWNIDKILLNKEERKVDVKKILSFIGEYLSHPSAIWNKMPLQIKLKLQWFQFPGGVIFDGKRFRTAKISSIFKLKELFLAEMYPNVHYPGLNYEHEYSANFSPFHSNTTVFWEGIELELKKLDAIINAPELPQGELRTHNSALSESYPALH